MIFHLSFFIFSFFISYIDFTRYKIPNVMIVTLSIFLIIFGFLENKLIIYSFIILIIFLLFFVTIILLMPKMILGGGDIKYILVITLYLQPISIPIFLIVTGIVQTIFLLYYQKIKKRRVAPMAPAIFLSVIIVKINEFMDIYNIM
ncbi:prepilin peptidase [Halarcobacter sp.]|uniref:prepilin peptidase n=1 Tax=Halarcobacter sp. TaxID=2321133 RepID=UPI002AA7677B|nr:prepilin peptidase [Halarcobacter sp.]